MSFTSAQRESTPVRRELRSPASTGEVELFGKVQLLVKCVTCMRIAKDSGNHIHIDSPPIPDMLRSYPIGDKLSDF